MKKIILVFALFFLFLSMYYFFLKKDLFLGSITVILSVIFNFIYASLNKVNLTNKN